MLIGSDQALDCPRPADMLERAIGQRQVAWDRADPVDTSTKIVVLGLLEALSTVDERLAELAGAAETARAALSNWRILARARTSVVFMNDAGNVAQLPLELVRVLAKGGTLNADVSEGERTVCFHRGGELVAEIPKSLAVNLTRLLERQAWETHKSPGDGSQSHVSAGNPSGRES